MISIEKMTDVIEELMEQHLELTTLALQKTEAIKNSDMESLSTLLMKERKQIAAIVQLEEKRQRLVEKIFEKLHVDHQEKTISQLLEHLDDTTEKEQLEKAVTRLVEVIVSLRQAEQLNDQLIQQSLEFVQLSLDMLQPSVKNIQYNNQRTDEPRPNQSVFDSRA